jgi:hypothetical protein
MKTQNTSGASARNPRSIIWHDFQSRELEKAGEVPNHHELSNPRRSIPNMITKVADSFASTQDNNRDIVNIASASDERLKELGNCTIETRRSDGPHEQKLGHSRIHNFYTQASILTLRGIVALERVRVDERISFNLLPTSIAVDLDLILYSDRMLTIRVAHRLVATNQFCRFTIQVAGLNRTIDAGVISGFQDILLGREWMRSVNLITGFGNQSYYIPVPLTAEAAEEHFPGIDDTEAEAKDEEVGMATSDGEEYDDDDNGNVDCGGDDSSNSGLSSDDEGLSDDETLSDSELSSPKLSSASDPLSDSGMSSGDELILDELAPTDEEDEKEDEAYGDDENYEVYE